MYITQNLDNIFIIHTAIGPATFMSPANRHRDWKDDIPVAYKPAMPDVFRKLDVWEITAALVMFSVRTLFRSFVD